MPKSLEELLVLRLYLTSLHASNQYTLLLKLCPSMDVIQEIWNTLHSKGIEEEGRSLLASELIAIVRLRILTSYDKEKFCNLLCSITSIW